VRSNATAIFISGIPERTQVRTEILIKRAATALDIAVKNGTCTLH
jgi:hypothetical protein